MTRDEIYSKVRDVLVEALAVDEEDVIPTATLKGDLGAESIDILDTVFRLEQTFGIKIQQGELFTDIASNPQLVVDGKVTSDGLVKLKSNMPHVDFSKFEKNPQVDKILDVFTVESLVKFVEQKIKTK